MPNAPHKHKAAKSRREVAPRATARQRGYSHAWDDYSSDYRKQHPICAECERQGRVTPAHVVDHIIPHKGDHDLLWNPDNHQPLCDKRGCNCHGFKTANELTRDKHMITVVCGEPGSGKTTYVEQHAKSGDIVWDWDKVAHVMTGLPMHTLHDGTQRHLQAMFVALCRTLESFHCGGNAWLIVTDPTTAAAIAARVQGRVHRCVADEGERQRRLSARNSRGV